MSLSVLSYIHVPLFNIDMSLFCIDMNIEAHFYRYIDISDINDSSMSDLVRNLEDPFSRATAHFKGEELKCLHCHFLDNF